jgi:two-component system, cell cycle sensor histidine kinase and response regulator CckA
LVRIAWGESGRQCRERRITLSDQKTELPGSDDAEYLESEALPRLSPLLTRVITVCLVLAVSLALTAFVVTNELATVMVAGAAAVGGVLLYGAMRGLLGRDKGAALFAQSLLDSAPEAYLITRRGGTLVYCNRAYRQLLRVLGFGQPVTLERALAGRTEAAQPLFRLARAARRGLQVREELPVRARDGGLNWFWVEVQPLEGAEGRVSWRIVDASAHRDAGAEKAELDQRVERLRSRLDTMPLGVFTMTSEGRVEYVNASLEQDLGYEPGGLAGISEPVSVREVFFRGETLLPGEDRDRDRVPEGRWHPMRLRTRRGEAVPVHILMTPFGGEAEHGGGWLCVVSPDARATGGAHPQECETVPGADALAPFASFFESAPVAILLTDFEGRIVQANQAAERLTGCKVVPGSGLADLFADDHRGALGGLLESLAQGESAAEPLEARLSGDGRTALVHASLTPGGPGRPAGAMLYLVDITEQRNLEMQFAQSQKMQAVGQLAGGIAHDFNNLLTAIIGFSDLLLARHRVGDPSFKDLNHIKQNATRAANLTRQLLAFSRQQTLRPQVIQLTDALADLSILLRRLLGERIKLEMVHGRDLGLVKVDRGQLEQVIINLAVNARDAMPEGGRLTIRTGNVQSDGTPLPEGPVLPRGDYVAIEVSDTGTGMSEDVLGKIFEPFFTTKGVGEGTGLGLSTVYGIVEQTGGFIFPESRLGRGTTFRIYLPRLAAEAAEAPAAQEEAERPARDLTGRETILLVEDEDTVRTFAARALKSRGYDVIEAPNGEDALRLVESHENGIDLLVTDVVMPVMDGPALVKKIREKDAGMPIVYMSGYAETSFRKDMESSEDVHFLPKPFTLKQLLSAVKEAASGTRYDGGEDKGRDEAPKKGRAGPNARRGKRERASARV